MDGCIQNEGSKVWNSAKGHKIWGSKTHKTVFGMNNTNNETVHAEKLNLWLQLCFNFYDVFKVSDR